MYPDVSALPQNTMPGFHVPSKTVKRLRVLFRCNLSMIVIFLWSISVVAWSFQHPTTNRIRRVGNRQNDLFHHGIRHVGLTSSSRRRVDARTFLHLSSPQFPSYRSSTPQELSMERTGRDMGSLSEWAQRCEIVLADGVELLEDAVGDWSLSTKNPIERGSSILTIPAQVILTSDVNGDSYPPHYDENDMQKLSVWMNTELESGSQAKQDYLPEYMLVYKLIREVYLGPTSRWYQWIQSLPVKFSTGLYLDEVERSHVERMTGEYIRVQGKQYQDCLDLFTNLISSQATDGNKPFIPIKFYQWMLGLRQNDNDTDPPFDDLLKWAFSIVFTRSWRSPDRKHAQIVPLGDLANHDSQLANLKPGFRKTDGAFQFFVTSDVDGSEPTSPLYLSYGLTYAPARYLVLFGFCDVTAGYIDANLDFLPDIGDDIRWPTMLEPSELVVSTTNGALSEEVWVAFLYKILQEREPSVLEEIEEAFSDDNQERGDKFLEQVLETWEWQVGKEIQAHYQKLLKSDFAPISVTQNDFVKHPNLSMIVNYNLYIRETYLSVLQHVTEFLSQCEEFQEIPASQINGEVRVSENVNSFKSEKRSMLEFQNNHTRKLDPVVNIDSPATQSIEPVSNYTQIGPVVNYNGLLKKQPVGFNFTNSVPQKEVCTSEPGDLSTMNIDRKPYPDVQEEDEIIDQTQGFEDNFDQTQEAAEFFDQSQELQEYIDEIQEGQGTFDQTNFLKSLYGTSDRTVSSSGQNSEEIIKPSSTLPAQEFDSQYGNSEKQATSYLGQTYEGNVDFAGSTMVPTENFAQHDGSMGQFRSLEGNDQSVTCQAPYGNFEDQPDLMSETVDLLENSKLRPDSSYESSHNIESAPQSLNGNGGHQTFPDAMPKIPSDELNPPLYSYNQPPPTQAFSNNTSPFQYENPNQQSYSPYRGSQERNGSTIKSSFSAETFGGQSYPGVQTTSLQNKRYSATSSEYLDQSVREQCSNELSGPQQENKDPVASYAQSLLSDQRGDESQRQNNDNQEASPTATTYAEYLKQRQEGGNLGTD